MMKEVISLHNKIVEEERHLSQLKRSTTLQLHEHSLYSSFLTFLNTSITTITPSNSSSNETNELIQIERYLTNIENMFNDITDYSIDLKRSLAVKEEELHQQINGLSSELVSKTSKAQEEYDNYANEYSQIEQRIHQKERENDEFQKEIEYKLIEIEKKKEKITSIKSAIELKQKEKEDEFRKMLVSTISVGIPSKRNTTNVDEKGQKEVPQTKKPRRKGKQNLLFPTLN